MYRNNTLIVLVGPFGLRLGPEVVSERQRVLLIYGRSSLFVRNTDNKEYFLLQTVERLLIIGHSQSLPHPLRTIFLTSRQVGLLRTTKSLDRWIILVDHTTQPRVHPLHSQVCPPTGPCLSLLVRPSLPTNSSPHSPSFLLSSRCTCPLFIFIISIIFGPKSGSLSSRCLYLSLFYFYWRQYSIVVLVYQK